MSVDIFDKVAEILMDLSEEPNIQEDDHLQNDIGLDSLNMITLLVELEEVFQIELDESDMNPYDLSTVSDVVKLIEKYGEVSNEKKG